MLRLDAADRLAGRARYTDDLSPPGMLTLAFVRSPIPAGRIRGVAVDAAAGMDGVVRVLTAADLPDRLYGNTLPDQPILAREVVRYVGEPVAMVAATSRAAAAAAVRAVVLDIEPLPAAIRLEQAMAADAPQIHAGRANVLDTVRIARGDAAAVIADSPHVTTTRVETQRAYQGYLEPRGALAIPADGGLEIVMGSQQPYEVRTVLAGLFDIPLGRIDVRVPAVGGGFGGKLHQGFAPHVAAMALATGRPVKYVCSRDEDMLSANPRENGTVELVSAAADDGRLLALRADVVLDSGAYALDMLGVNAMAAFFASGPYAIEHLDVTARGVYTNTSPTGSYRGPSGPQTVLAIESHLDEVAATLGLDPADVRRRNFIATGERGPAGELITADVTLERCLDTVRERLAAFRDERARRPADGRRRGYGYACAWWSTLGTPSAATVEMLDDGTAALSTGGAEIGTGAISTALPAIVADVLGIEPADVSLIAGSTARSPFDAGSRGSRTLFANGNATLRAAREVAQILLDEASERLEIDARDLVLRDGRIVARDAPGTSLPLGDVARSARLRSGPAIATARYRAALTSLEGSRLENARAPRLGEPTFHCHGAEIALDEETGRIEVERYVAVQDIGEVLNPTGAIGQVEGGVLQGIGYALLEDLRLDDRGAVATTNLHDYRMPTIADIPESIETILIDGTTAPTGPCGAKGIGEPPVIVPAAAIASALRDITGRSPARLPLDAPTVIEHIQGGLRQ
jgi:CO/xanthine dehydrogenase Mo-binding subunit